MFFWKIILKLGTFGQHFWRNDCQSLWSFQFGAVQKYVNFIDLEMILNMLQNEYSTAQIGFDTAETKPSKVFCISRCSGFDGIPYFRARQAVRYGVSDPETVYGGETGGHWCTPAVKSRARKRQRWKRVASRFLEAWEPKMGLTPCSSPQNDGPMNFW